MKEREWREFEKRRRRGDIIVKMLKELSDRIDHLECHTRQEFSKTKIVEYDINKCPVCLGKGTIPDDYSSTLRNKCHGCNGTGWVAVPESGYSFPKTTDE